MKCVVRDDFVGKKADAFRLTPDRSEWPTWVDSYFLNNGFSIDSQLAAVRSKFCLVRYSDRYADDDVIMVFKNSIFKLFFKSERKMKKESNYDKVKKNSKLGDGKRFKAVEAAAKKSGASDPAAVAAAVGRKKYGASKMAKMASKGKKK